MHPFALTATPSELKFISERDYGQDADRHLAALKTLMFDQPGRFPDGDSWYPLEVLELGANGITVGHEREFVICCLLVLAAIDSGHCFSHFRESKYSQIEPMLSSLPTELAELLLSAFAESR